MERLLKELNDYFPKSFLSFIHIPMTCKFEKKIILLSGPAGVGKSTWARKNSYIHITLDILTHSEKCKKLIQKKWSDKNVVNKCRTIRESSLYVFRDICMEHGANMVMEGTNQFLDTHNLPKEYTVTNVFMFATPRKCWNRVKKREKNREMVMPINFKNYKEFLELFNSACGHFVHFMLNGNVVQIIDSKGRDSKKSFSDYVANVIIS